MPTYSVTTGRCRTKSVVRKKVNAQVQPASPAEPEVREKRASQSTVPVALVAVLKL
jgi:hypothetical protein